MNRAWQRLPALRQFPPPFFLLPPPHPAPPSTFTSVPCDVHGPMCTVLNGSRTRIGVRCQCWTCFTSVNEIGAHIPVVERAEQQFYRCQRGAQFLSYYDDPYLSLAVQVRELRLGGILVASLIFFRYKVHLSLSCTQHNVRALRSISNRGSDGHARAMAFRE
jgi:hypothetical protein